MFVVIIILIFYISTVCDVNKSIVREKCLEHLKVITVVAHT